MPWTLLFGGLVLPYATLWASRSSHLRRLARRLDAGPRGDRLHNRFVVVGVASGASLVGLGRHSPALDRWFTLAGWTLAVAGLLLYVHVETFVAADELRRYPSESVLHFRLGTPGTWPATALRIVATWTWLLRTRHATVGPGFLVLTALVLGGSVVGLPAAWLRCGALYTLVLGLSCAPVALPGQGDAARQLAPRLDRDE